MKESKAFQLPNPKMPVRLRVSWSVAEYDNATGNTFTTVESDIIEFSHYDQPKGILVEILDIYHLLEEKELLEGRTQTKVNILSIDHPIPGRGPDSFPSVFREEAVEPIVTTDDPEFQEWLKYQHFPPNPDEPQKPTKTKKDE